MSKVDLEAVEQVLREELSKNPNAKPKELKAALLSKWPDMKPSSAGWLVWAFRKYGTLKERQPSKPAEPGRSQAWARKRTSRQKAEETSEDSHGILKSPRRLGERPE